MKNISDCFPCPCCDFLTRSEPNYGTFEICPICNWEDDNVQFEDPDYRGGANQESLNEAKENYKKFGASSKKYINAVRAPLSDEIPMENITPNNLKQVTYSKIQFAKEFKTQLDLGYKPERIGRWAHEKYMQYCDEMDAELDDIIYSLMFLEEGPEFEIPEYELRDLIKKFEIPEKKFNCRVCGRDQGFEPWGEDKETPTYHVCYCCGAQFGIEGRTLESVKKYRDEWITKGAQWTVPEEKPANWSLEEQLKQIPDEYTDISPPQK